MPALNNHYARASLTSLQSTCVVDAKVDFASQPFAEPLTLSSGIINAITLATAQVRVRVGGCEAVGRGAIYLSDLWAWPDLLLPHERRDAAMRRYCEKFAIDLPKICGDPAHPLSLGLRLHDAATHHPLSCGHEDQPPSLARTVCSSVFDAAIHDAVGQATNCSAFDFYDQLWPIPEADAWFDDSGDGACCRMIQTLLDHPPYHESPVWFLVSGEGDLGDRIEPVVRRHGLFAFKLKIKGKNATDDAKRTVELFHAARSLGVAAPQISIDSNEGNPDAQSVLDYLDTLRLLDAAAYDSLLMLEQPTGRNLEQYAYDWHSISGIKPILVDEGLETLDAMELARRQGWSGFALKSCKGHSFTLVAAAWAMQHRMLLSVQDLTNPGIAAIHAGLLCAHIPTINGVELNSWQFTPQANAPWLPRLSYLLEPKDGRITLPPPETIGLGSHL